MMQKIQTVAHHHGKDTLSYVRYLETGEQYLPISCLWFSALDKSRTKNEIISI